MVGLRGIEPRTRGLKGVRSVPHTASTCDYGLGLNLQNLAATPLIALVSLHEPLHGQLTLGYSSRHLSYSPLPPRSCLFRGPGEYIEHDRPDGPDLAEAPRRRRCDTMLG